MIHTQYVQQLNMKMITTSLEVEQVCFKWILFFPSHALTRVRNWRDLVMVNKICVYEVQFSNRISVIPEKWPGRRNFHIKGRNFHNLGENRSTFWGENFHIDNCTSEDVKTTLAWRHKILKLNPTIIFYL